MSVRDRMSSALRRGAIEPKVLAEEIGAKLDTITRTARRYKKNFTVLEGGRIALHEKERSPP
jgi:hypothetical protein